MKLSIDTNENIIRHQDGATPVYSQEGFRMLSGLWLRQQWNQMHWQSFSWLGFQIWQFPEDLLRLQEVIFRLKPDVIVETGVNQGGSAVFFASLCRLLGHGRVISIDITIPPHVRQAIKNCPFSDLITLMEGDSASPEIVEKVKKMVRRDKRVFVFLDSDHSKAHVRRELDAYHGLVTPGSYIVATDGVMRTLADTPHGRREWADDNPAAAAKEFAAAHPEFVIRRPEALYGNEYVIDELTYWPDAWLYRPEKGERA